MSEHCRCCHPPLHQHSKQKCFRGILVYNWLHAKLYQHHFMSFFLYQILFIGGDVTTNSFFKYGKLKQTKQQANRASKHANKTEKTNKQHTHETKPRQNKTTKNCETSLWNNIIRQYLCDNLSVFSKTKDVFPASTATVRLFHCCVAL